MDIRRTSRWNGGILKGCPVHRGQCLGTSQHSHEKERLNTRRNCPCCHPTSCTQALPEPRWLFLEVERVDAALKQGPGKAQGRQGRRASPSSGSGPSSAASQTLPLPPPPPLLPFPFDRPQPRVSGAARVSSADAAEGPRASSGYNLRMKTSALKRSNGENRQADTCARLRTPVIRIAPTLAVRFAIAGNLGYLL